MDCSKAQSQLTKYLDHELAAMDEEYLQHHLAECVVCSREMKLLTLPRRISKEIPQLEPSPYFYQRLRARLESESRSVNIWQIMVGISHRLVPAMAAITLALLLAFSYFQLVPPQADVVQAYDNIFMSGDRPQRMVIADHSEITDESVLQAIAEEDSSRRQDTTNDSIRGK
jgi:hypothetical protein